MDTPSLIVQVAYLLFVTPSRWALWWQSWRQVARKLGPWSVPLTSLLCQRKEGPLLTPCTRLK